MGKYQTRRVSLEKIKPNDSNPRSIKDAKFQKLVANLQSFPEMLEIRPIVVNDDGVILGGNMRYQAAKHLGWKDIPVINAKDLTEEQRQAFIILDNQDFGEWNFEVLANEFNPADLVLWGFEPAELGIKLDAPEFIAKVDDDEGLDIGSEEDFNQSHVKMVQLFMNTDTYPEFIKFVDKLQSIYGTDNVTDTVFKAVENAYNNS